MTAGAPARSIKYLIRLCWWNW